MKHMTFDGVVGYRTCLSQRSPKDLILDSILLFLEGDV